MAKKGRLPEDYFSAIIGPAVGQEAEPELEQAPAAPAEPVAKPVAPVAAKLKSAAKPKPAPEPVVEEPTIAKSAPARKRRTPAKKPVRKPVAPVVAEPIADPVADEEVLALEESGDIGSLGGVLGIIEELEGQLRSAYEMREALEQDVSTLSTDLDELRETDKLQKRRISFLEEKIPDLETLREELEFAEREKARDQARVARLEDTLEARDHETTELNEAMAHANDQLHAAKAANTNLETDLIRLGESHVALEALREEHSQLLSIHEENLTEASALEDELKVANAELDDLQKGLENANISLDRFERDNARQESANVELGEENQELRGKIALLEVELGRMKPKLTKAEADCRIAREDKERLEADLLASRKTVKDIHRALAGARAKTRTIGS